MVKKKEETSELDATLADPPCCHATKKPMLDLGLMAQAMANATPEPCLAAREQFLGRCCAALLGVGCGEMMAPAGSWYCLLGARQAGPAGARRCCDRNRKGSFSRPAGWPICLPANLTRPWSSEEGVVFERCLASSWQALASSGGRDISAVSAGMQISEIPMCDCPRRHHPSRALQHRQLSCPTPLAPELELLDSTRIFAERPSLFGWDQTDDGQVARFLTSD